MADVFVAKTVITEKSIINTGKKQSKTVVAREGERHIHALSSFCQNPVGLHFKSQDPDESIFLLLRPHWITNLPWIFTSIFLLLIPSLLALVVDANTFPFAFLPDQSMFVYVILYYLMVFAYMFISFIHWFYNIFIITDREIVDVDFSDLVYHDVAATNIVKLEDVNYTKTGFLRSLFDYGDLFVQTAGGKENLEALAVPHPDKAAQFILNALEKVDANN